MNNAFSIKRFSNFACAEFKANGRQFFISVLGVVIISLVYYSLYYLAANETITNINAPTGFSVFTIMIATLLVASMSFKKYFSRTRGVESFMIPASKLEKFTYHYLANVILYPLVTILCVWLLGVVWSLCLDVKLVYIHTDFIGSFNSVLSIISTLSIFFLGAVIFRRLQFLFTILSIGAIITVLTTIAIIFADSQLAYSFVEWIKSYVENLTSEEIASIVLKIATAFNVLLLIATSYAAWKKFKNLQTSK